MKELSRAELLTIDLAVKRLVVGLTCIEPEAPRVFTEANQLSGEKGVVVAVVPPRLAQNLLALVSAGASAYTNMSRGKLISRKPGLDVVLYLLGERNIAEAIDRLNEAIEEEGRAVVLVAGENREAVGEALGEMARLYRPSSCKIPVGPRGLEEKYRTSFTAVFAAVKKI